MFVLLGSGTLMSDDINYKNNPLHGLSLKNMLSEIVDFYGFQILHAYLNLNCFKTNPSIESSVKFLKKTDWAREKVESFYLYQYKSLPRASDEQFALSPRDRIIPDDQKPGEPAELSIEDAERLLEKRARKDRDRKQSRERQGATSYRNQTENRRSNDDRKPRSDHKPTEENSSTSPQGNDPWAKWR